MGIYVHFPLVLGLIEYLHRASGVLSVGLCTCRDRPNSLGDYTGAKPNKHTKSTKISSLFSKRGNRNTKRTEKHKNKMTHGKTYNKSPRRINHKATKSKTNTGTTVLERSSFKCCLVEVAEAISL